MSEVEGFAPTHRVPDGGMPSWSTPDPAQAADGSLEGTLPVQVLEETTGWAHVRCSNGWECWVDAGRLVATDAASSTAPVPGPPPVPAPAQAAAPAAAGAAGPNVRSVPSVWLSIMGAALAIVGGFLPWYSAGGIDVNAWDIRILTLFTREESDLAVLTGVLLLIAALSVLPLLTGRLLPGWASMALAGVPTIIGVAGLTFYYDLPDPRPDLGIGLFMTLVGAVVMAGGAAVSPRLLPRPLIRLS